MLFKTPMLSLVAVFTIGLGVALTTHTFSSVYGTIGRGLPVPGEERLTFIDQSRPDLGITGMTMSMHEYEDVRDQQTVFEDLGAFYQGTINVAGDDAPPSASPEPSSAPTPSLIWGFPATRTDPVVAMRTQ